MKVTINGMACQPCERCGVDYGWTIFHDPRFGESCPHENPVPQVPAMATSVASGQNVGVDRAAQPVTLRAALCDERPAGGSNPAALDLLSFVAGAWTAIVGLALWWMFAKL